MTFTTPLGLTMEGRADFNIHYAGGDSYIIIESMAADDPIRSDDGEKIREGDYAVIVNYVNTKEPHRREYFVVTKRQIEDGAFGDTTLTPSMFRIVSTEEYNNAKS